ncbi:protein GRAVITROPIC IN THE LIGHT 1-like [Vicia villosa]|uniref:protein GRAVITROPIC IN THE LIGHT 1-like n=1 Tax=Vicia villosa TaxID=3911 RepID=UPI00273CB2C6|nr:protein GRAVITROPIC IN THE LIGHT 1-like [Vicia villosa]
MESVKPSAVTTPSKKLARNFAKVLHLRAFLKNVTISETNPKDETTAINWSESFNRVDEDEELQEQRVATEALLAKVFASVSTVKGAYAELQHFQSPFDPDGIEASDKLLVSELKHLSELKQCYLKKQFDPLPEKAILEAESKETKGVIKTYEVTAKKLESQVRLKDSEIMFLKEKLAEANSHNKLIEKRLNQSGSLSVSSSSLDNNVHISGLSPSHFASILRHTVKSIRNFVRLVVDEMRSAKWDIDAAVDAIEHNVVYLVEDHKCFAIESFVCKAMFDAFHFPNFNLPNESLPDDRTNQQNWFFQNFNELKSTKVKDFLASKPRSSFAKFCMNKYLRLVHPKMESSFFGNMNHRNFISNGEFPKSEFFASFAEMAKRVYLLHCLAYSFKDQAEIFQVSKGCRFSDVYMESVNDEIFMCSSNSDKTTTIVEPEQEPVVGFTVVPGFRIGKTVLQCQVYLMQKKSS